MRPLIAELLNVVEELSKKYPEKGINIVLSAPTGYGKTVTAPLIFKELTLESVAFSQQHVMPLRAIVRDFYVNKLIRAIRGQLDGREDLRLIRNALIQAGINEDSIAYQMGEFIEAKSARKDPLFESRYVVTTFDSFAYNLLRIPLTEVYSSVKHYVIPRMRIYLSSVYFDEAHMLLEEEGDKKLLVAVHEILRHLSVQGVPLILASATMSSHTISSLKEKKILRDMVVVKLSHRNHRDDFIVEVLDKSFIEEVLSVKWNIRILENSFLVNEVVEHLKRGLSVLVVSDRVNEAVERYYKIIEKAKGGILNAEFILLHGKLSRGDRISAINKLSTDRGKPLCLVATSVIEAGVDFSFDVLISDAGRVESFIQRTGRVCRKPEKGVCRDDIQEAYIYVVKDRALDAVVKYAEKHGEKFIPRLPFDYAGYKGYEELLEIAPTVLIDTSRSRDAGIFLRDLKALLNTLYISSMTINEILRRYGNALTRTLLLEAIISTENIAVRKGVDFSAESSISIDVDAAQKLVESKCISGVAAIELRSEKEGAVVSVLEYDDRLHEYLTDEGKLNTFRLILWSVRRGGLPSLVIREDCYIRGLGLKPWVPRSATRS